MKINNQSLAKNLSVLFVTTNFNYNGAKKYIVVVANELAKRGYKVGVLFDSGPLATKLEGRVIKYHVKLSGLGLDPISRLKSVVNAAFLAKKEGYKVIHDEIYGEVANSIISHKLLSFLSRSKIVETIHYAWETSEQREKAAKKIDKRADWLIAIPSSVAKVYGDWVLDRSKVTIIQNGINIKEYDPPNSKEVEELRKKLGINKKDPVLVAVSRVSKVKNFEAFINWFPYILSDFPNARFVIVGDNGTGDRSYLDQVIEKVKSLGLSKHIIFVGGKTEIKPYLGLGNIFTITGLAGDLSVMEAMATGLPVVVSRLKYQFKPELVKDGETGLLFDWGDWQKWASQIKFLLSKPDTAKQFGESGKTRVRSFFTIERYVDELEKVYRNVLLKG